MTPIEPPIAGDPTGQPLDRCDVRAALDALVVRSQAVGLLMAEFGISADAATQRLSGRARDAGLPVEIIAADLVAPYSVLDDGPPGISRTG